MILMADLQGTILKRGSELARCWAAVARKLPMERNRRTKMILQMRGAESALTGGNFNKSTASLLARMLPGSMIKPSHQYMPGLFHWVVYCCSRNNR